MQSTTGINFVMRHIMTNGRGKQQHCRCGNSRIATTKNSSSSRNTSQVPGIYKYILSHIRRTVSIINMYQVQVLCCETTHVPNKKKKKTVRQEKNKWKHSGNRTFDLTLLECKLPSNHPFSPHKKRWKKKVHKKKKRNRSIPGIESQTSHSRN